jgi:hypothetical protein
VTNTGPFGSFTFHFATDAWAWSEEIYAIHGFRPGDVVPTTELVLAHKHPGDRAAALEAMRQVRDDGRSFSLFHRLVDAQGNHRQVLALGEGWYDEAGALVGIRGRMIDLTEAVRHTAAREVEEAIEGLLQSRPLIEQVKGALMLTYRLDSERAFLLLRRYSQLANIKVRDVARDFVAGLATHGFPADTRAAWDRIAAELVGPTTTDPAPGQAAG